MGTFRACDPRAGRQQGLAALRGHHLHLMMIVMVIMVINKVLLPLAATIFTSLSIGTDEWPPGTPPPPPPSMNPPDQKKNKRRMRKNKEEQKRLNKKTKPPALLGGAGAGRVEMPLVPLTHAVWHSSSVSNLFALPRQPLDIREVGICSSRKKYRVQIPPYRKGWHSLVTRS